MPNFQKLEFIAAMPNEPITPIALFAYNRADLLERTLACLRQDSVPMIYAFSDGARSVEQIVAVNEVRDVLKQVDWCDLQLIEREQNLGLGRSIVTGVTEVLLQHDRVIVYEDDLISVPGTYQYLCAAMTHYQTHPHVMSVTGWTHPLVVPRDVGANAYLDGRAECLVWGTWARAWHGMQDTSAMALMKICKDPYRYGADLVEMAHIEKKRNLWAVRWLFWHMAQQGLCVRPPHSLVEHIGSDSRASNTVTMGKWQNPPLQACPPIPQHWADVEHADCVKLWQKENGTKPTIFQNVYRGTRRLVGNILRRVGMRK
jgi:hypothetical protein